MLNVPSDVSLLRLSASNKQKVEVNRNVEFDFSSVATNQMGDRSAREPMKVVPSRDITSGRRKEPMNRGLPNGTSLPQGNSHYAKGYLPN
jgi:hypothetical protein